MFLWAALMLLSTAAVADLMDSSQQDLFGPTPEVPTIYSDGLTRLQVPNLTLPERSAFSMMESIQQLGETYVQARGCPSTPLTGYVDIFSNEFGSGDATVVTSGGTLVIKSYRVDFDSFRGDRYVIQANNGQKIGSTTFNGILGNYRFNKTGSIMEGGFVASVPNPTANNVPDLFTGRVIKDFFLVKDDGIEGVTKFVKTRIAGGVPCTIEVSTRGYNNPEQFNEQGHVVIKRPAGL